MTVDLKAILDYHQTSKHNFKTYAPGPHHLDMQIKPESFLNYNGAQLLSLDKWSDEEIKHEIFPAYEQAFSPEKLEPSELNAKTISRLFLTASQSRSGKRQKVLSGLFVSIHPVETFIRLRFTLFPDLSMDLLKAHRSAIMLLCLTPLN
ncbi:MAG: hypothetical protein NHB15_03745 [Methanosarcina barkeri]|nr:hypothetical protein [Methanosarcina sp. ERenArc_MAG2]